METNSSIFPLTYTKDPRSLTSFLIAMLWISLGFEVITIFSDMATLSLLGGNFSIADAEADDTRQGLIGSGYFVTYVITGIAFLMWIYRANLNSRGFGVENMRFTPGWAVGYYFIPFVNLVFPYQAMKEIWQASLDPSNWQDQKDTSPVGLWWTFWIISNILAWISLKSTFSAMSISALQTGTIFDMLSCLVGIPLCLSAIHIVKTISHRHEELVRTH